MQALADVIPYLSGKMQKMSVESTMEVFKITSRGGDAKDEIFAWCDKVIRVLEDWKAANGGMEEVEEVEVTDTRPRIDPNLQEEERLEYLKI
jgi:hypothetical protein